MIRPIDLQTLFVNMDKVGKEHAQTRENVAHQQSAQAQKILQHDDQTVHSVIQTTETQEEAQEIKTDIHKDELPDRKQKRKHSKKSIPDEAATEKSNEWKDPDLGSKIDISG